MSIIDNLSLTKKRFLNSIGIFSDGDIPKSFYEKIRSLNDDFSEDEKYCIGDYNFCYSSIEPFNIKALVGTDHDRYANKTWLDAFIDLDRGEEIIELYFNNPDYYSELKDSTDLGLAKKGDKYYILGRAGGGNNRLILMKIKSLAEQKDILLSANVRYVPSKETSENIFNLVFPNGGYQESGYQAINKSDNPNIELYDIVSGYPHNTQIVMSNILGKEIDMEEKHKTGASL